MLAYDRDLGKRWGRHRLAGVFQYNRASLDQRVLREHILVNAPTPLTRENASNRVWRRTYFDLGGPSEKIVMANFRTEQVSGRREAVSGQVFETAFIPFNSNTQLLRGHPMRSSNSWTSTRRSARAPACRRRAPATSQVRVSPRCSTIRAGRVSAPRSANFRASLMAAPSWLHDAHGAPPPHGLG